VAETLPPAGVEPLVGETDTENVKKLAVTLFGPSMVTVAELLVPVKDPVQASNAYPELAVAVNVTLVPES
jgi:hypothetical protein